jgi:hypothetical protein
MNDFYVELIRTKSEPTAVPFNVDSSVVDQWNVDTVRCEQNNNNNNNK